MRSSSTGLRTRSLVVECYFDADFFKRARALSIDELPPYRHYRALGSDEEDTQRGSEFRATSECVSQEV